MEPTAEPVYVYGLWLVEYTDVQPADRRANYRTWASSDFQVGPRINSLLILRDNCTPIETNLSVFIKNLNVFILLPNNPASGTLFFNGFFEMQFLYPTNHHLTCKIPWLIHRVVQPLQLILKDFYLPRKETLCLLGCSVLSYVRLFVTPWTVACQLPLSMGFPR